MIYDVRDSFLDAAHELPKDMGRKIWKCLRSLSQDPGASGLNLERLRGRAEHLWSVRVDEKYRAILRRDDNVTTLLFVGTHEDAYRFAERVPLADRTEVRAPSVPTAGEVPPSRATRPALQRTPTFGGSPTAKYVPLASYLLNAASTSKSATMTFAEIEDVLGASLPASARRHRAWWGNDTSGGHVQAIAWLSVGWKVAKVNLSEAHVVFELEGRDD
jgi:Txe/YoeB family toxin of Txe-Axe toxin-antitoxin module